MDELIYKTLQLSSVNSFVKLYLNEVNWRRKKKKEKTHTKRKVNSLELSASKLFVINYGNELLYSLSVRSPFRSVTNDIRRAFQAAQRSNAITQPL